MIENPANFPREVLLTVPSGAVVPVFVRPGEVTAFEFQIAEHLWAKARGVQLRVHMERGRPTAVLPSQVLFRRDRSALSPWLCTTAEFSTATRGNTLRAADWARLFPSDVKERKDVLVPMLGRSIWHRLASKGKISGQEPIVGINVSNRNYRAFQEMDEALDWAEQQGDDLIYFNRLDPELWRVAKGIGDE